jgi:hypothetical protein
MNAMPLLTSKRVLQSIDEQLAVLRELDLVYTKLASDVHAHRYANRERIRELEAKRERWVGS